MRRLVIDYLRSRRAIKRGGEFETVRLDAEEPAVSATDPTAIETLDLGLEELGTVDPGLAELVDLHFFCGFSFVEIAAARGVSDRTVQRDWRKARMFLQRLATE